MLLSLGLSNKTSRLGPAGGGCGDEVGEGGGVANNNLSLRREASESIKTLIMHSSNLPPATITVTNEIVKMDQGCKA